jgi:hypothetical protein
MLTFASHPSTGSFPQSGAASLGARSAGGPALSTTSLSRCAQTDADFACFIVGEVNAGLFWSVLNLEHFGKVSFHHAFALFDPLKRRQADLGGASKLTLAPARAPLRCLTRAANASL